MLFISVTLLVLKLLTSRLVKLLHMKNILLISVTLLVSNLLTSRLVSFLHIWNMQFIVVTALVFKYCMPTISERMEPSDDPAANQ